VVSVNVIRRQRVGPSFWDFSPFGSEREVPGLGSGIAIASGGFVLTNAHVVQGAIEIVVATVDGNDYPAELVGLDELADIALLRVDAEVPIPEFGDSDNLVTGEPAIAIGNPFGYLLSNVEPTVTVGVISGTGRHILPSAFGGDGETMYADMIQTDASINPGNSGGPLVNADGQVVGINSAIFSRSGGSQGLGFSIPINRALRIADQLRTTGEVRRPWVGIDVGPAESDDRMGRRRGAQIVRVVPGSPAETANLTAGMELVAVQGRPVKSHLDWEAELLDVSPGETVNVTVRNDAGREVDIVLQVEDLPSVDAARIEVIEGLELITLTDAIQAERGLRSDAGALIAGVSDPVTRVTDLRQGDLIVQINRRPIGSAEDAAEVLQYLASQRADVQVVYERGGRLRAAYFRVE
jgi:serine protease Do